MPENKPTLTGCDNNIFVKSSIGWIGALNIVSNASIKLSIRQLPKLVKPQLAIFPPKIMFQNPVEEQINQNK